mmetsp:Transcript_44794/g.145661  ORF Transcript_44794/g.145661 Transcript_44794/m.145661 type:complete len:269 (-) Transcript_44794:189-995(-)
MPYDISLPPGRSKKPCPSRSSLPGHVGPAAASPSAHHSSTSEAAKRFIASTHATTPSRAPAPSRPGTDPTASGLRPPCTKSVPPISAQSWPACRKERSAPPRCSEPAKLRSTSRSLSAPLSTPRAAASSDLRSSKARGEPMLSLSIHRSLLEGSSARGAACAASQPAGVAVAPERRQYTPGCAAAGSQSAEGGGASSAVRRILLMSRLPSSRCTRLGCRRLRRSRLSRKARSPPPLSTLSPPKTRWHPGRSARSSSARPGSRTAERRQ